MLKNYFISFPNYIIFASVGITTDACHCYYFWNYYILILEWIPFWLKKGIVYCIAGPRTIFLETFFSDFVSVVWRLLFVSELFLLFQLEVIQSMKNWFIYPLLTRHLWSLDYIPGLRLALYTQYSKLSQHGKDLSLYPFHRCETEASSDRVLSPRPQRGRSRSCTAWLLGEPALSLPVLRHKTLNYYLTCIFLTLPGFQFSVPNWNQILLTLEVNTVNQRAVHRINECLSWRGREKALREQEASSSPRCGCSPGTQRAGPGQLGPWAECPRAWRGHAVGKDRCPSAPACCSPPGPAIAQGKAEISVFCETYQVLIIH